MERAVIQQLDELRPHLARSALLSARLQLERARVASETLAVIGLPALAFYRRAGQGARGQPFDRDSTGYVQWRAHDRLSLSDGAADRIVAGRDRDD